MHPSRLFIFLLLCLSQISVASAQPLDVIYPRVHERPQDGYGYRLLELALRKSGEAFTLRVGAETVSPERARMDLQSGIVSVLDFGVSPEFETRFEAVYFLIDLGLSGYRRLIVHKARAAEIGALTSMAEVSLLKAGQGPGWADTRIIRNSGIPVDTASFLPLFRMLEPGRFDFLPLGIEEAEDHLNRHRDLAPNCTTLAAPVLHYRFARLFFVTPGNKRLSQALQAGLERAFDDGSLRKLLTNMPGFEPLLAANRARLQNVIELNNPWLTPRFMEIPKRYFLEL